MDDEPQILKLLELTLKRFQDEWEMNFARSGQEALAIMEKTPCDILVSDMRMPSMTGVELLHAVMQRYPSTVRIILSGYADQAMVLNVIGVAHMYLTKPIDIDLLKSTLNRMRNLHGRFSQGKISSLTGGLKSLPSMPSVYLQIMQALQSSNVSSHEIGEIVATDPGLCAKVLQLSNSAFLGSAANLSNPEEAVQFLGVSIIGSMALSISLFASLDPRKYREFQVEKIWNHSVQTGLISREMMWLRSHNANLAELAFTAGLLHDVGKLVLLDRMTDSYRMICQKSKDYPTTLRQVERSEYNVDHAEVGGYLLGIWGLPVPLVEAVCYHHEPQISTDSEFTPLTAVHVANVFAQEKVPGQPSADLRLLDAPYLARLNLLDQVTAWQTELSSQA